MDYLGDISIKWRAPVVLKSTGSAFEDFVRDEYTTLVEVNDRILSTSIDLAYTFVPFTITAPSDEKKLEFAESNCCVASKVRPTSYPFFASLFRLGADTISRRVVHGIWTRLRRPAGTSPSMCLLTTRALLSRYAFSLCHYSILRLLLPLLLSLHAYFHILLYLLIRTLDITPDCALSFHSQPLHYAL